MNDYVYVREGSLNFLSEKEAREKAMSEMIENETTMLLIKVVDRLPARPMWDSEAQPAPATAAKPEPEPEPFKFGDAVTVTSGRMANKSGICSDKNQDGEYCVLFPGGSCFEYVEGDLKHK